MTPTARTAWLANLKVGDEVAVVPPGSHPRYWLRRVTRVRTRTFECGAERFWRRDGEHVLRADRLEPVTAEVRAAVLRAKRLHRLIETLCDDDSARHLSDDTIAQLVAVLDAAREGRCR